MSKRRRIGLFLGLFLVAALIFAATRSREPVYQGKKLSKWLAGFDPEIFSEVENLDGEEGSPETRAAIRHIGTNALPLLLQMLRSHSSPAKLKIEAWMNKQDGMRIRFHDNDRDRYAAVCAFHILGSIAKPAIPELVKMLNETNISEEVCSALGGMGRDAIPALTNAFSCTNDIIRESAIWGLRQMETNAESALPVLISCLQDSNPRIRRAAVLSISFIGTNQPVLVIPALIRSLGDIDSKVSKSGIHCVGRFGNQAQGAVPKLVELLRKPDNATAAAFALANILGTNKSIAPITQALTHNDAVVQSKLINLLGSFKAEARETILVLLPFARGEGGDWQLRRSAIHALGQIAREPELVIPVLIENLSPTNSWIRHETLEALQAFGPEAKAAVPILLEQIELIKAGETKFGVERIFEERYGRTSVRENSGTRYYSEEFQTLQKIDPAVAKTVRANSVQKQPQ